DGRPTPGVTTYTYNTWNLLGSVVEPSTPGQTTAASRTFTTEYDLGGLPVIETQPGATIARTFNDVGALKLESGSGAGLNSSTRNYGRDLASRLISFNAGATTQVVTRDDRGLVLSVGPAGAP